MCENNGIIKGPSRCPCGMQGPRGEGDGEGGGDNTQYLGTETINSVYCAQKVI